MTYVENITEFNGIKIKSDQKTGSFDATATLTVSTLTEGQKDAVHNTYPYTAKTEDGTEVVSTVLEGTIVFNIETKKLCYYTMGIWKDIASSEIVIDKTPVGTISMFGANDLGADSLWKECNGESILKTDYPELYTAIGTTWGTEDETHFNLPDLRGVFVRGRDHGTDIDPDAGDRIENKVGGATGDNVGSYQIDQFKSHSHTTTIGVERYDQTNQQEGLAFEGPDGNRDFLSSAEGGNETRPKNVYVMYVIKCK
ncbi:MAG: phage tail protein [Bacteroidetes bacterium]|nr:phage tail protein [Bacteroidota bacterium]